MKSTIVIVFSFITGGIIGGFASYKFTKKKYENLADEEIESVKKAFEELRKREKTNPDDKNVGKKENKSFEKIPNNMEKFSDEDVNKYIDYSKQYRTETADNRIAGSPSKKSKKNESSKSTTPYIITPDEFNESHYESRTLYYYADKFLTDDEYILIEQPEKLIGSDALGTFGLYEDDAVYIRDDSIGVDYEVLLDERFYMKTAPKIKPSSKIEQSED